MNIRDQLFKTKYGSMYRFGGKSDSNQSNSSSTSSNTSTSNTTNNTTSDWSYSNSVNTTDNKTNTVTQDRRLVNDHGVGVSSDGGNVRISDSGNSVSNTNSVQDNSWYNNSSSSYSSVSNISMSDFGAISAAKEVQLNAMGLNGRLSEMTVTAGRELSAAGIGMLNANIAYAKEISKDSLQQQDRTLSQVKSAFDSAMQQVSYIASKPLNASDPQHVVVIVGLVILGIYVFKGSR